VAASEDLQPVFDLAYRRARALASQQDTEAPEMMRSFIHFADVPPRGLTVAREVLQTDPKFRRQVLAWATETNVGADGLDWLRELEGLAPLTKKPGEGNGRTGEIEVLKSRVAELEEALQERTDQWRLGLRMLSAAMQELPEEHHQTVFETE